MNYTLPFFVFFWVVCLFLVRNQLNAIDLLAIPQSSNVKCVIWMFSVYSPAFLHAFNVQNNTCWLNKCQHVHFLNSIFFLFEYLCEIHTHFSSKLLTDFYARTCANSVKIVRLFESDDWKMRYTYYADVNASWLTQVHIFLFRCLSRHFYFWNFYWFIVYHRRTLVFLGFGQFKIFNQSFLLCVNNKTVDFC